MPGKRKADPAALAPPTKAAKVETKPKAVPKAKAAPKPKAKAEPKPKADSKPKAESAAPSSPKAKASAAPAAGKRVVTIEASKECGCFKVRTAKVERALAAALGDAVEVRVNPERPRKGCFEVRSGDKVLLSLLDMPRPFTALKALDMDAEAQKIAEALR